ncbi:MAG: hypothetical protein PHS54_01040 [Clostridia bacterium]|nr:hypothetical protein [Clostridia bacterium]
MANQRKVIDKGMIEEFGATPDANNFREVIYHFSEIFEEITTDLSKTNSYLNIKNIELIPFGDYANNTEITNSEIDLYLAVKSAQIELNSIGPMESKWKNFWNRVVNAWKNRKANTRKAKKRAKKLANKQSKMLTIEDLKEKKEKPYTILSFKDDYYNKLVDKFTTSTILYNQHTKIKILAKDEFGFKINIYPAFKHENGIKTWDNLKNKFVLIKPLEAQTLLKNKNEEINLMNNFKIRDSFYRIVRIFKSLYFNIYHTDSYLFIDSLIYNCPDTLFRVDSNSSIYKIFIKILNYLNNTDISKFKSIYNNEKTITEQENINFYSLGKFIKEINEYLI